MNSCTIPSLGFLNSALGKLVADATKGTLALAMLCAGHSLAATETEPNNSLGTATPMAANDSMAASIDPGNDNDWFAVSIPGPGRLVASVPSPPAAMKTSMSYFDRNAEYGWRAKTAVNPGDSLDMALDFTEAGTYFLKIHNATGDPSGGAYTLHTAFSAAPDANEPNNRVGQATLVSSSTMNGKIFPAGENDWFRLYVTKDENIAFELDTPAEMRGRIDLYDSNFDWLWAYSEAANPGDKVLLNYNAAETGMIYIRIRDMDGGSHLGDYTLKTTGGTPGHVPTETPVTAEAEDNDTIGAANRIDLSTSVSGAIGDANDKDWFTFVPTQTGQVTISMDTVPANLKPILELYDDSGNRILSARAGHPGDPFAMTFDLPDLQRRYLRIFNSDASTSASNYQFSSTVVPVSDPHEPNDNYGDRTPLSNVNQLQGYFFPANDQDWYEIQVSTPGALRVFLEELPENITPKISILDLSRNPIALGSGMPGTDYELTCDIGTPGSYIVVVGDAHGNESTHPYTLTILGADFAHYAPVATIESIDPGAAVVGDNVAFAGSGTDSDGTITAYEWTSDIDGVIGTQASFSTNSLSVGNHLISFRVRDNDGLWSTKATEHLYVGSTVSEETEPNGWFSDADEIALNQPVTAKIGESRDLDYYKFFVPGPGRIVASLTNVPANLRMIEEFYNRYWKFTGRSDTAVSAGGDLSLVFDATEAGFLYLKVFAQGDDFNEDYTYTMTVHYDSAPDPFEPNNSLLDATVLGTSSIDAYFFPAGDDDWYKVWVPLGGALHAEVTSAPSDVRARIDLYGPDRQWLWRYQEAVNPGEDVAATADPAPEAGYYYIRVRSLDGLNWTDTYTLSVTGADPGHVPDTTPVTAESEDNNAIQHANPVALGSTVTGALEPAGDNDWFRFEVPGPGILHAKLDPVPESIRAALGLYQDDTGYIGGRTASNPGDPLDFDWRFTHPGIYYIRLYCADSGQHSATPYTVALSFTRVDDTNEPNNHLQEATVVNGQNRVQGYIFDAGDADWFQVHSEAGGTLRANLAEVPAEIRPKVEIYDRDGNFLASRTASNDGQAITVTYPVPETADYFIRVLDVRGNRFSTDPYILVVDGAVFDSYVPIAVIDSVSPNPAASGETVTLEGHGDDVDGSITGYEWASSIDGVFSQSRVALTDSLSSGAHTITFRVRDDDGNWSSKTSTLLYYAVPAPEESEPNDVAGSATPMDLGKQYTGEMNHSGDADWFRIHVPQAGRLVIQGSNPVGSAMRLSFSMYLPDLEWGWNSATANNDGDPLALEWDLTEPGDYYLLLRDAGGRVNGQYTVSANLTAVPDPYEPNPDYAQAATVQPDDRIEAWIFPANDNDWYRVHLPGPGALDISLTPVPADLRMHIDVYDANHEWTWVGKTANNAGDEVFLTYNAAQGGDYYLRIRAEDHGVNPGESYTLNTVFTPAPDAFEPNYDARHAPWIAASPLQARIFPKDDEDWFRVHADPGSTLVFTADPVPGDLRIKFDLYNANLDWIGSYATAPAKGEPVTLTFENASGDYYLRVRDADGSWSAGQAYQLSVSGANLAYQPPSTPATAESEPNNSFPEANFIGTEAVSGGFGGDNDWFRFDVSEASLLTASLVSPSGNRSRIILYDANKAKLFERVAENKGDASSFQYAIETPGTYYLLVSDADGATSADPYTLDLDLQPAPDAYEPNNDFASAAPIVLSDPVSARIFPKGDSDWFLLETTEPGTLAIDITGVASNLDLGMNLYDANKNNIGSHQTMHGGDPIHFLIDLENPGIYRLSVFDRSSNAYSLSPYSLTATLLPFDDANEPNDTFALAAELSGCNQTTGMILPRGDADWFRFRTAAPGLVRIQVARAGGIQPKVYIYDDSKARLADVFAQNTGDSVVLSYYVPAADNYYVLVVDQGNNDRSTLPYILTIQGGVFDSHCPIAETPEFSPNPALTGETVQLVGTGSDEDGTVVAYEWTSDIDGPLGTGAVLSLDSLSEGLHRVSLRVRDDEGHWSAPVARSLIVSSDLGAEAEYNNTWQTANPIPPGQWTVASLNPGGDNDYYKIHVDACGLVRILVDALPMTMRPALVIYDAGGNDAGLSRTSGTDGAWFDFTFFAAPGWYHVRLYDADGVATGTATYAVRYTLDSGADPYEPNANFAQATRIDPDSTLTETTICPSGDNDYYKVSLPGAGRLTVELRDMPETMSGRIDIYDANYEWTWSYVQSLNGGDPISLDYDVAAPGTYYIRIKNNVNASDPQPYRLVTRFTSVADPFEANNSLATATLLSSAANHAYIFPREDNDWYKIWLDKDAVLDLSLTGVPDDMQGKIELYNANGDWLWAHQEANNPGDEIHLSYTAPADGMYFIRVRDQDVHHVFTAPYTLNVSGGTLGHEPPFAAQPVESEDNGNWAGANDIDFDTNVTGSIDPNGDKDIFRVRVNQTGLLGVSMTNVPADITSEITIYNQKWNQIAYRRTTNPGEDNHLDTVVMDPGYYYIRITDRGGDNSSTDLYTLRVTHTPVVDTHEPNNSFGAASTLGSSTVSGYLFGGSDEDWFRFHVRYPGPVAVSLTSVPADLRPHIYLYDDTKQGRGDWVNTNPGVGGDDLVTYNAPAPGFYYVRVRDEDGHYSLSPYTLRVSGADFSGAPVLAEIGDRTLEETVPYSFTIAATDPDGTQNLAFSAVNLPPGATFDPDTRTFSWTPARGQAGTYPGVRFEVSDGTSTDSEEITLTVNRLDQAPELAPIGDKQAHPDTELSFQISATDPDPGDTLTYSADNLPSGASFDPATRTFSWTPASNQLGTHRNILFRVTDGLRTDFEYIDIEVTEQQDTYEAWLDDHFTPAEQADPSISGPDADPDGDGATNREEYDADTDPRDAGSKLELEVLAVDATGVDIQWRGGSAATQYVERKFDLGDPAWEVIQTVHPPTPATNTMHIPFDGKTRAFYRIRAQRE